MFGGKSCPCLQQTKLCLTAPTARPKFFSLGMSRWETVDSLCCYDEGNNVCMLSDDPERVGNLRFVESNNGHPKLGRPRRASIAMLFD
mmetsp:Transcript_1969/g.4104  ORF Transcript_1969/g.4104 Transcript_1969/m.4104 type:complete len:88 (-) Transcript_1969:39-302(-)